MWVPSDGREPVAQPATKEVEQLFFWEGITKAMRNALSAKGTAIPNRSIFEPAAQQAQTHTLPERPRRLWVRPLVVLALVLSDVLFASLFWGLGLLPQNLWTEEPLSASTVFVLMLPNTAVWIGMRALMGLYPGYGLSSPEELRRQTYATVATLAITGILASGLQVGEVLPVLLVGASCLERLLLAPLGRHFVKLGLRKIGIWGKPIVIIGAGETGRQLVRALTDEWGMGYKPVGVFDFRLAREGGRVLEGVDYGGTVNEALRLAQRQKIDTVIFAMKHVRREYLARYVDRARCCFRHVIVIPNLGGVTTSAVMARDLSGTFGVEIKQNLLDPWTLRTKWILDLVATVVGGTLILLPLLVIGLLVRIESRGGVFYRDKRMGKDGKLFSCLKFRTMVPEAEAMLQRLLKENAELRDEYSKYHKLRDDPRITRVGRFLRKTSLDELPQLWNVLRGEMSLVGPRPYLLRESEEIYDILHEGKSLAGPRSNLPGRFEEGDEDEEMWGVQNEILHVPPGITGPWQVAGRNRTSFKERVEMDAYYVRNWSIWADIIYLARTVGIVVSRSGAY